MKNAVDINHYKAEVTSNMDTRTHRNITLMKKNIFKNFDVAYVNLIRMRSHDSSRRMRKNPRNQFQISIKNEDTFKAEKSNSFEMNTQILGAVFKELF